MGLFPDTLFMKNIVLLFLCSASMHLHAQELFTWSEPASNMAAKSIGIRVNNYINQPNPYSNYTYRLSPEVMWGISKKFMLHVTAVMDNDYNDFTMRGAGMYLKYRFYSQDDVHNHFRMALFARASVKNGYTHSPAIDLEENNSGYELGLVSTKLVHKVAVSGTLGYVQSVNDVPGHKFKANSYDKNAMAYSFSFGKLMLPKEYVDYKQTNLNLMLELLGQTNLGNGYSYLDAAPVVQLIILSRMRVDLSYRFAMLKKLERGTTDQFLLRLEYNIFNAYK